VWAVEYSRAAIRDFDLIFDHLLAAYGGLGDASEEAWARAADRLRRLRSDIDRLVDTPHIGTLRPDIHPGIRFLRRDRAAIWFLPDEARQVIVVAAVFFGGQDHITHMLARMLEE